MDYYLSRSKLPSKKYTIITPKKTIHFGATGYSDYTKHRNATRKQKYIDRHKKRENWNKSGINTAGFWSRWLLWNKPTLTSSIRDTEKKFGIRIHKTRK